LSITISPVRSQRERHTFLTFPWRIYRGDPNWVPPILSERAATLDPRKGTFFKRGGVAECFIAWRDGQPVGTICAADDTYANALRCPRDGMFGFFDSINDREVAHALLQTAVRWVAERNLQTLYGPFNLDYEDGYGVLIEGFDCPPAILCGHSPPYYQSLIESFGLTVARGEGLAYRLDLTQSPALQQLEDLAIRARRHTSVTIRPADLSRWDDEVRSVHMLLNTALAHLPDFIPWHLDAVQALLSPFRQIADPNLILFAEANGQVVGFLPGIPDLNEALIHANGLRYPWDYAALAWHMHQPHRQLTIKSVLVLREYWGGAIPILLFAEMLSRARSKGYQTLDLSITSADNPRTPQLAERLGARLYKRWRVYRTPLDDLQRE
jgi:GNAT superfamily N-acetyltransferase